MRRHPDTPPCPIRTRDVTRIAAVADVSTPAVRRVIAGYPGVRLGTVQAVTRAAAELGIEIPSPLGTTPKESSPRRCNAEGPDANHPGATHGDQPQDRSAA